MTTEKLKKVCNEWPAALTVNNGLIYVNGKIKIPATDTYLQLKLIVASHCGALLHCRAIAKESILKETFALDSTWHDVHSFFKQFVHCIVSRPRASVPQLQTSALHGIQRNEIVHIDYL